MTTRLTLSVLWLGLGLVPLGWWLQGRRHVDVWRALPVPAAILDRTGAPRARSGPGEDTDLRPVTGLPAPGRVARTRAADGTVLALSGLRGGGALSMALLVDPVAARRDRVLAELGSRLAHDLGTPVSALHGHLDLIAHQPITAAAQASVRTCQRELARLQRTAEDLLTYTRLRTGGAHRAAQPAGALAEEAAAALLDRADELGAALTVHVPQGRVLVEVAEADLVRALRNLIRNALDHGLGAARAVDVAVDATADTVTFTVTDSGPGLSDEQLRTLSAPLVRGSHEVPGTGLGLTIVDEVLVGHGSALRTGRDEHGRAQLLFSLPRHR